VNFASYVQGTQVIVSLFDLSNSPPTALTYAGDSSPISLSAVSDDIGAQITCVLASDLVTLGSTSDCLMDSNYVFLFSLPTATTSAQFSITATNSLGAKTTYAAPVQ